MPTIANLNLKDLYDTAVDFITYWSPTSLSFREQATGTPDFDPASLTTVSPDIPLSPSSQSRQNLEPVDHWRQSCRPHLLGASSDPRAMPRGFDDMKNEIARSHVQIARLEERCRTLEMTLKETKDLLRVRDADLWKLRKERDRQKSTVYDGLNGGVETQNSGDTRNERSIDDSATQSTLGSEEYRARTRSAETFMTRSDSLSGAQILQVVYDLNSEIIQFSASVTELYTFEKEPRSSAAQSIQDTTARLGPNIAQLLASRDHSQDPILVQLALQGAAVTCVARALMSFCMAFPSKLDSVVSQLYSHIYVAEPQPTSSRWRALAHRHIHTMYPDLADYAAKELSETVYRWSIDILAIAGCSNSSKSELQERFGERVHRIVTSVFKLVQITREEIMSTNFDVVMAESGSIFDSKTMSDALGDYGLSGGPVLTTTELGLRTTTRKEDGEIAARIGDGRIEQRLLLRPKVVLESVQDLLDS